MLSKLYYSICAVLSVLYLSACATTTVPFDLSTPSAQPWAQSILSYKTSLAKEHPDRIENLLAIPASLSNDVVRKFGNDPENKAIEKLAKWLLDEQGQNLGYDINADLAPVDVLDQGVGNCLSFTILLVTLAQTLNIQVLYNEVDVPEAWGSRSDYESVLYEHVNAVQVSPLRKRVFDLAIESYRFGYPQKVISEETAIAKLYSNRSVAFLGKNNVTNALHYGKLAASYAPLNSSIWGNLGVVYKRMGNIELAEALFLHSLKLNSFNIISASNLERLYRADNKLAKAQKYRKLAIRARRNNPYFHYHQASNLLAQDKLEQARFSINQAIRLHAKDPKFFELLSKVDLRQNKTLEALHSLGKAYKLAQQKSDRKRYAAKFLKLEKQGQHLLPAKKSKNVGIEIDSGRG